MPAPEEETTLDARTGSEAGGDATGGDADIGRRIGPYRIQRLIGRGGMGRVYLAVREADYRQRVALKLIEDEENLSVLDRFYLERQILAHLEHPNVARILDGGSTGDALPYFVMEYVEGVPVDRYCEQHDLSLPRRLELFREVCLAVHHAHQNLVVHRDLKPGNILVTSEGTPKLLDFGIAKLLDAETLTGSDTGVGERRMTFSYASPEQVREKAITTATDVYSLGVLLYKLLSGRHPYQEARGEPARLVRAICEEDPEPLSTVAPRSLRRQLAGDLDAVVAKAMQKKPQDRYASAQQLAEDVRRHLADLPVVARPETWWERVRRGARRHKLELAAVLLVLAFAVSATVFWRQAERERSEAEDARLEAEKVSGFLTALFESAGPDAAAGEEMTVREALERGRGKLEKELQDEPEVRAELVGTLGTVYGQLGFYRDALELKEEALRLRRSASEADRSALARDLNNLAKAQGDAGDYAGAERRYREAMEMWRRLGDGDWITAMSNLAAVVGQQGRDEEALELHRQVLEARRKLYGERHPEVAWSLYNLGVLDRDQGRPGAAEPLLREALDVFSQSYGPRHTQVAAVWSVLGDVLQAQGRLPEARRCLEQALDIRLERLGEDHPKVANVRKHLAALLIEEGEPEAAGALLQAALVTLRRARPEGDWTIADTESIWGSYLAALGRYEEAEPVLVGSYETIRNARGGEDAATRKALQRVIRLYEARGDEEKAAAYRAAAETDGK